MSLKFDYKSSMRGIRRCPRCGSFNGNRASKCKNTACQQKLRDNINAGGKVSSSHLPSVVELLQANQSHGQLYSVSHRNGVRYFISSTNLGTVSVHSARHVTIGSVEKLAKDSIKSALLCCKTRAEAVPLLRAAIDSLGITEDEKHALWKKQSVPGGPLVQRISEDLFAVGHWQTAYGLCHVTVAKKDEKYTQLHCECDGPEQPQASKPLICWHILALAAALLSSPETYGDRWSMLLQQFIGLSPFAFEFLTADEQIANASDNLEMQSFLSPTIMELFDDQADEQLPLNSSDLLKVNIPTDGSVYELAIDESVEDFLPTSNISDIFATDDESLHLMDCQIELMDEFDPTDRIDFCPSDIECDESLVPPASPSTNLPVGCEANNTQRKEKLVHITAKKSALKQCGRTAKEKLTRGSYSVRKLLKVLESNGIIFNRLKQPTGNVGKNQLLPAAYEATLCNLNFTRWLEAVIEQLNAVIDYNTDGKPPVQTFRVHEDFFRCLRSRFSVGHRLRQPERRHTQEATSGTTVTNREPQLYKFTHPKSLLHVFRTDEIELCFEKRFIRTSDDQFVAFEPPENGHDEAHKSQGIPIQPYCYSTYIKLGRYKNEADPERVYYFVIEWIGGVLPRSGFGDLLISFEFGHRKNKQYVPPPVKLV